MSKKAITLEHLASAIDKILAEFVELTNSVTDAISELNTSKLAVKSASYIKSLSVSGKTITYTKGDDTTGTLPTQDTTYSAATTSAAGLMSADDKTKLDGITAGANKYTHPTYTAKSAGLYKVTVDGTGHVSAATAVTKDDITALGIPSQDTNTTYGTMTAATSSAAGSAGLVPAPAAGKQASYLRGDGTWAVPTNTTYSAATTSAAGLMSANDKSKLDGITASADTVAFTRSLTSGTKVGTLTINGTGIDLYAPTDTNTTYSQGTGISISGTTINNSGVRSVATGSSNGTISVNTNGTTANVAVKGLGTAAYCTVVNAGTKDSWGCIPVIGGSDGVMEVGKYLDFHCSDGSTTDYDARITASTSGLTLSGTTTGTFSGNATSATKLATARTLTIGNTGKSFNGTANVSWTLSEIGAASASDIAAINLKFNTNITKNAFTVDFDTVDEVTYTGSWNSTKAIIEF